MRVAIFAAFGGFGSFEGLDCPHEHLWGDMDRDCPKLCDAVEKMGEPYRVVEIPDDAEWYVSEYDGNETIREGRTWRGEPNVRRPEGEA